MRLFLSVALFLPGVLDFTIGSTPEPYRIKTVEESISDLYDALANLERRDRSDLVERIKTEIMLDLAEWAAKEKEQILNTVAEMNAASARSVDERLRNERNERLLVDNQISTQVQQLQRAANDTLEKVTNEKDERLFMYNHILKEVQQLQSAANDSLEKVANVKNEVTRVTERGRIETDMLEVKINETENLVHSCLAYQRGIEDAVRKNMSSSVEILKNHTSEISSINTRLIRVENRCSDPPHVESGHPIDVAFEGRDHEAVVTYACRGNKITAGNDLMKCRFGKWTGELPRCVDPVCDPPCDNGGICTKNNFCSCPPLFSGARCQNASCDPPCDNGGECMEDNSCSCPPLFGGERCQYGGCPPKKPFTLSDDLSTAEKREELRTVFCENYDYAWKGKLNGQMNKIRGFVNIPFLIEDVVKAGVEEAVDIESETRTLLTSDNCNTAKLLPGVTYLILGRDGQAYKNEDDETRYRYLLDQTSVVYMWTTVRESIDRRLQSHLNHVTRNLKEKGCEL